MVGQIMIAVVVLFFCISGCTPALPDADLTDRGYEYLLKKDYEKAENHFVEALRQNPNNPYALLNLGVIYERTERKDAAKVMYELVVRINAQEKARTATESAATGKSLKDIAIMNIKGLEER